MVKIEKIKLGNTQLTLLLCNAIAAKLFLTFPHMMVENEGSAAWIQVIYVSLLALLIFWITYRRCFCRHSILDLSKILGGRWLEILTAAAVSLLLIANILTTVQLVPESIKTFLLPNTPSEFILLLLALAVCFGAYMGIEALARLHALFVPIFGAIMLLFFLFILPHWRTNNLFPIFGTGTYNIFVTGTRRISIFTDIILLNLLLPYCKNRKSAVKCGFAAILIGGFLALCITILYCGVYPYPISAKFILPMYQLVRLVRVGEFFGRTEAVFEFVWSISTMLYIAVYISVIAEIWRKTFRLGTYKPLIFLLTLIIFSLALFPIPIETIIKNDSAIRSIVCPILLALPIILSCIYSLRGHKNEIS